MTLRKEDPLSVHAPQRNDRANDSYAGYASAVGPRILEHANQIIEDLPVSKYALYFVIFMIEVALVFYVGVKLVP